MCVLVKLARPLAPLPLVGRGRGWGSLWVAPFRITPLHVPPPARGEGTQEPQRRLFGQTLRRPRSGRLEGWPPRECPASMCESGGLLTGREREAVLPHEEWCRAMNFARRVPARRAG